MDVKPERCIRRLNGKGFAWASLRGSMYVVRALF